jgi:hypothetical protein
MHASRKVADFNLGKLLETLLDFFGVISCFRQEDIRHFVVVVNMQNVGLLLVHSRGSEKPAMDPMKIIGIRTRQLLELIVMLLLDTFTSFVVRVSIFCESSRTKGGK